MYCYIFNSFLAHDEIWIEMIIQPDRENLTISAHLFSQNQSINQSINLSINQFGGKQWAINDLYVSMDTCLTKIRKNYSLLIMISKSHNDLVMILVYLNLITIYE